MGLCIAADDTSTKLWLDKWAWTEHLGQSVAAVLPSLSNIVLIIMGEQLTDDMLNGLLQIRHRIFSVGVDSLALQSTQHGTATWPVQRFAITNLSIADVVKMPSSPCVSGLACQDIDLDCNILQVRSLAPQAGGRPVCRKYRQTLWHFAGPTDTVRRAHGP